jgi:hypothetical protein
MFINGLIVLGLFIVAVVMMAIWNSQSKIQDTVKSETRNDPEEWPIRLK